jgi:hypothetical protein
VTLASNDEVERRGVAPTTNEADLSQTSTPSLAYRRCNRRDRSNLGLDCRATTAPKLPLNSAEELTPSLARRKDSTGNPATSAQRRLLNTAATPMNHAPCRGPNRTRFGPCRQASRRSRADLEAQARESKGAFNRVLPVNPRITPNSAIKVI